MVRLRRRKERKGYKKYQEGLRVRGFRGKFVLVVNCGVGVWVVLVFGAVWGVIQNGKRA